MRVTDDGAPTPADHTADNRSPYDRIAARYAENHCCARSGNEHTVTTLQSSFLAGLPAGGLIADLGCGPASDGARVTARVTAHGFRVVGMDLSAGDAADRRGDSARPCRTG